MKAARTGSKPSLITGAAIAAGIAVLARLIAHPSPDKVRGVFDRAPRDDEPLTAEDEAAIVTAMADPAPSVPWEQVKAEARRSV